MTHLNFSVEQHGGIHISLSGNVSTFFSSDNIEKIQKSLSLYKSTCANTAKCFLETNGEHLLLNTSVQLCSVLLRINVIKDVVEPW